MLAGALQDESLFISWPHRNVFFPAALPEPVCFKLFVAVKMEVFVFFMPPFHVIQFVCFLGKSNRCKPT